MISSREPGSVRRECENWENAHRVREIPSVGASDAQ